MNPLEIPTEINTNVGVSIRTYNQCISFYLMSSLIYYHMNIEVELMTDNNFDLVCKYLLELPDNNTHKYKHMIDKDSLRAGTGFDIKFEDYPTELYQLTNRLLREMLFEQQKL